MSVRTMDPTQHLSADGQVIDEILGRDLPDEDDMEAEYLLDQHRPLRDGDYDVFDEDTLLDIDLDGVQPVDEQEFLTLSRSGVEEE